MNRGDCGSRIWVHIYVFCCLGFLITIAATGRHRRAGGRTIGCEFITAADGRRGLGEETEAELAGARGRRFWRLLMLGLMVVVVVFHSQELLLIVLSLWAEAADLMVGSCGTGQRRFSHPSRQFAVDRNVLRGAILSWFVVIGLLDDPAGTDRAWQPRSNAASRLFPSATSTGTR